MKIRNTYLLNLLFTLVTFLLLISTSCYAWNNGQDATFVIAQADFTSASDGTSEMALCFPTDVAIDTRHHKLYAVDGENNRVLRFAYPLTGNQPTAELVFGQPDFSSNSSGTTQNTFSGPRGVAVDNQGRLWVSEYANMRVVWFNDAYDITENQPNADGVLGQPDFVTLQVAEVAQTQMGAPYGLSISPTGTLYVADRAYSRVLRFDDAASKANGGAADAVLGQPDFVTSTAACDNHTFSSPRGVLLMGTSLFVADRSNSRVLRFDNVAEKENGADADGVLGQTDTSVAGGAHLIQSGMEAPSRLAGDPYGRLYVSDGFNYDRVLIFENALELTDNAEASSVLGQVDFTSSGSSLTASGLSLDSSGGGMAFDPENNSLFVADTYNNRVLQFDDQDVPDSAVVSVSTSVVENIGTTRASLGGTASAISGYSIEVRGIVYSTTDTTPYRGETEVTFDANGSGAGSFVETIGDLQPDTTYYYRAYGNDGANEFYGDVLTFTTDLSDILMYIPAILALQTKK